MGPQSRSGSEHDRPDADAEILQAVQRATREFAFCPNRVWGVAKCLPDGKHNLSRLFPPNHDITRFLQQRDQDLAEHSQCTFDLCEQSQRDFTSVHQRHEISSGEHHCRQLEDHFPRDLLDNAAKAGRLTAWALNGKSIISFPQSYMAISHVWLDGTGCGTWPERGVNHCLWNFFLKIAQDFQVDAIW
ncbi:uncharacterized protein PV07_01750 [Cladophialophora immunda]|uniref:Uncharacterized protein n=1 Tax=Cladophialophora immunda TaxID=569365 RepID=A0A0D2CV98_9EURO|nr:uncharacterized protein PV07_01750 [Cladophialophora immunda]KIW35023.1 hypothetical protein PV07_01750 [Cladophialophora immunda]